MMLWKMEAEGYELLLKLIEKYIGNRKKLLEVGCGNERLMNKISSLHNVEIKCADPYGYGRNVINIEGEKIDELNEKFDMIYSIMSFHHLHDPKKFLNASLKAMMENAVLIIVDWKNGVNTGFPEYYYSVDELLSMMHFYDILGHGNGKYHLYVVASPNQQSIY